MNPWWLKPAADEEPAAKESPREKPDEGPGEPRRKPKSGAPRRPKAAAKPGPRAQKKTSAGRRPEANGVRRVALLCDPESLTRGLSEVEIAAFDLEPAIQRLLETGKMVVRRAYADWEAAPEFRDAYRKVGFELIAARGRETTAGAAGIQLTVDAMELCQAKDPIDTFVLISGDGSLAPLVSKLQENERRVLGVGLEKTSSRSLVDLCDDYLFCDAVEEDAPATPQPDEGVKDHEEAMRLMIEAIETLVGEDTGVLWGSVIKQTIQRGLPSFAEADFGFSDFSELLEEGERRKLIKLKKDERSGTYIVTGFSPSK